MIGGMPILIKTCAQEIPFDTLEEGDVILHNDPYRGGLHCPEHTFFKPFFVDGELMGFAVCIGHIAEIGGMVPGAFCGEATEIFHEGLRVPPVKIKKAGEDVDEVWKLLLANTRTPRQNYGDLSGDDRLRRPRRRARISEIVRKYGKDVFRQTCEDLMDYSERRMRAEIAALPGRPLPVRGRHRERRHRGQALHGRDRHLRPGRRGGGRLLPQLAAGAGPDQRHPRRRDRGGLQRHAAHHRPVDPEELRLLPADPGRLAAGPRDQRRLSGPAGRRQHRDPPAARQHRDRRHGGLRARAGDGVGELHRHELRVRRQPSRLRRVFRLLRHHVGRLGRPVRR